jgi:hypothetical protein
VTIALFRRVQFQGRNECADGGFVGLGEDIDLALGGELYGFASGARPLKHRDADRLGVIDEGTEVVWARGQLVAGG